MNNRLQELANQAELYVDLYGRPYPRAMSAEEADAAYKKFAQLMLEECMEINRKRLIPSPLWENDEHRKSHNQALWCAISDMKELLV